MGYALLWLEAMAFALLFVAAVFAETAGFKKRQTLWPISAAVFLFVLGVVAATFSGFLFFRNIQPQWVFPYALCWALVFPAGAWWVIRRGGKKDGTFAAATWPKNPLAFAWMAALALTWVTMDALDNARKLEAVAAQTTALTKAQTILPSPPPRDQDASPIYDRAIKLMGKAPNWLWSDSTDPAFDPKSEEAQQLLQEKKLVLQLLKEAVRKPHYYHPLELSFDHQLPNFSDFRNASRLLAVEARSLARDGKIKRALENIAVMQKIGDHLAQTPTLIHNMIANAIYVDAKQAFETILAEMPPSSAVAADPQPRSYEALSRGLQKSLIFEDTILIFMLADTFIKHPAINMATLRKDDNWITHMGNKLYRVFMMEGDLAFHQEYWDRVHDLSQKPYAEIKQELEEWEGQLDEDPGWGLLTSIATISSFSKFFERIHQGKTQLHLKDLGRAAAAYQSRHNQYPSSLEALVPEFISAIPNDPFDGKPFKMAKVDGGLILYGIGPDEKDDGGMEFDEIEKTGDITFCLGTAFEERRLKPALEKMSKKKKKRK